MTTAAEPATSARDVTPTDEARKRRLEIEKLERERKTYWISIFLGVVPWLTVLLSAGGLIWSMIQANEARKQSEAALRRSLEARTLELQRPFLEKQLEYYLDAVEAAAAFATLPEGDPGRSAAESKLRALYYGGLAVVENTGPSSVEDAMHQLGPCLGIGSPAPNEIEKCRRDATSRVRELTTRVREAIRDTWNLDPNILRSRVESAGE